MTLANEIRDREYRKFVDAGNNKSYVLTDVAWDYIGLVQAALTDTWTFKYNGSTGTTIQTIVVTYTDATKATISKVEKS